MTWVALDDQFSEHPKVDALTDGAFRLHVAALCYCNRHLTDGVVPADRLARLVPKYRRQYVDELVDRLLWVPLPNGTHYAIHDYLDWNKSRSEVEETRSRVSRIRAEAGRRGAEARWGRG